MKKIFVLLMCLAMVAVSLPTLAFAEANIDGAENATYQGYDSETDITVTIGGDKATLPPEGTQLSVEKVKTDEIASAMGTEDYTAYKISLLSGDKGTEITNWFSDVSIKVPIPESLKDKKTESNYIWKEGTGWRKEWSNITDENNYMVFKPEKGIPFGKVLVISEPVYTEDFGKITTDGTWTVNSIKPNTANVATPMVMALAEELIDRDKYYVDVTFDWENFVAEKAVIGLRKKDYSNTETHEVKIIYNEPDGAVAEKIKKIGQGLKYFNFEEYGETSYVLDDLNLINYYRTCKEPNFQLDSVSANAPLNFVEEVRKDLGGDVRLRIEKWAIATTSPVEGVFVQDMVGPAILYYNDIPHFATDKQVSLLARHVIYVPTNTNDYLAAAEKRLKKYLGDEEFSITLGGSLSSLSDWQWSSEVNKYVPVAGGYQNTLNEFFEKGIYDKSKLADDNYYKLTINGTEYIFVLYKVPENKIKEPTYFGSDIETNVNVTSDDTSIPLDTTVSAAEVSSDLIKKAVGTDEYTAYDINLHSRTGQKAITKLTNGKFKVWIPIPEGFERKNPVVYYVAENGDKTEYDAKIEDGFVTFETDHFSTYAITAKEQTNDSGSANKNNAAKPEVPKTGDRTNLMWWLELLLISFMAAVAVSIKKVKRTDN